MSQSISPRTQPRLPDTRPRPPSQTSQTSWDQSQQSAQGLWLCCSRLSHCSTSGSASHGAHCSMRTRFRGWPGSCLQTHFMSSYQNAALIHPLIRAASTPGYAPWSRLALSGSCINRDPDSISAVSFSMACRYTTMFAISNPAIELRQLLQPQLRPAGPSS